MIGKPIDVWDIETFDAVLLSELHEYAGAICDYMNTEIINFVTREQSDHREIYPKNPHSEYYNWIVEHISDYMNSRTIRAWHYTRLTDDEAGLVRQVGIYPSTLATIRRRLDARTAAGDLTAETADGLFAASPFHHHSQGVSRSNKFWMTSHPISHDDIGVELLLGNWGGEGVYFWLRDPMLEKIVACIGKPRVLELEVPISVTSRSHAAAVAVIAAFGRSRGCRPDREAFDLYSTHAIGPEAVIKIHTELGRVLN